MTCGYYIIGRIGTPGGVHLWQLKSVWPSLPSEGSGGVGPPRGGGVRYLLSTLGLLVVQQVGALQGRAHDGQALARFQLVGEGEEPGLLHVLLRVHAHQHQQLRPRRQGGGRETEREAEK